ncbi:hypothetical protein DFJ43DRAFT_1044618 [Lentinula guzmanii]|uniref:Uncharacterized protein n=1 Tax=Lentinula guzmanii TaxID=2804957 RepID=A0AA38MQC1_9AGAR|nr:hypothetical protein DFJ43DRAFT_1044618 [Lentinula guzmanii]
MDGAVFNPFSEEVEEAEEMVKEIEQERGRGGTEIHHLQNLRLEMVGCEDSQETDNEASHMSACLGGKKQVVPVELIPKTHVGQRAQRQQHKTQKTHEKATAEKKKSSSKTWIVLRSCASTASDQPHYRSSSAYCRNYSTRTAQRSEGIVNSSTKGPLDLHAPNRLLHSLMHRPKKMFMRQYDVDESELWSSGGNGNDDKYGDHNEDGKGIDKGDDVNESKVDDGDPDSEIERLEEEIKLCKEKKKARKTSIRDEIAAI